MNRFEVQICGSEHELTFAKHDTKTLYDIFDTCSSLTMMLISQLGRNECTEIVWFLKNICSFKFRPSLEADSTHEGIIFPTFDNTPFPVTKSWKNVGGLLAVACMIIENIKL